MTDWTLYILECRDGSLYTGITNDLDRRVTQHSDGTGAKYTKGRGPFKIVYTEALENRSQASKREIEVKALSKIQKQSLYNG